MVLSLTVLRLSRLEVEFYLQLSNVNKQLLCCHAVDLPCMLKRGYQRSGLIGQVEFAFDN